MFWIWLLFRRGRGRKTSGAVMLVFAVICFGAVLLGISQMHGEPDCDGKLQPNQVCKHLDGGPTNTYAQEKASDQSDAKWMAIVAGVIGVICLGVGVGRLGKSPDQLRKTPRNTRQVRPAPFPTETAYAAQIANYAAGYGYPAAATSPPPPPPPPPPLGGAPAPGPVGYGPRMTHGASDAPHHDG